MADNTKKLMNEFKSLGLNNIIHLIPEMYDTVKKDEFIVLLSAIVTLQNERINKLEERLDFVEINRSIS